MHELKTGIEAIQRAEEHLKAFSSSGLSYDLLAFNHNDVSLDFERKRKRIKAAAWRYLIDRIELKKLASMARAKEIDHQLYKSPETLPEITLDNLFGWLAAMDSQARQFLVEAADEVYRKLRPSNFYKTNSAFRIGKRVILTNRVERAYVGKKFSVRYIFNDELRAIDNVFHLLAGVGLSAYRDGELCKAIAESEHGTGETQFFRFKCFRNGNLHLDFLRPDLVTELNKIGGNALPEPTTR